MIIQMRTVTFLCDALSVARPTDSSASHDVATAYDE